MTENKGERDVRAPNGEILLQRRTGYRPLRFGDDSSYSRRESVEVVLWLLSAASSGAIGNYVYDRLKELIAEARLRNWEFARTLQAWLLRTRHEDQSVDLENAPVVPDGNLRDMLVKIAKETIRIYWKVSPSSGKEAWSEVQVSYSENHTWCVYIREVGAKSGFTIEIDLKREVQPQQFDWVDKNESFPVRIWF